MRKLYKCLLLSSESLFFFFINFSSISLLIIARNVNLGSTIISDKFASYLNIRKDESYLDQNGFYHFWVNHSKQFVDSYQPFIHTNGIERSWRSLRNQISSIKRTFTPKIVQQYLDTFMLKSMKSHDELYEFMLHSIYIMNNSSKLVEDLVQVDS